MRSVPAHLAGLVAGLLAGCAGSFLQAATAGPGPVALPVGLALAVLLTVAAGAAAGRLARARTGALAALAGWLVAVVAVSLPRPEGDLVVRNDVLGLAWVYGGAVLAAACALPPYPARRPGG